MTKEDVDIWWPEATAQQRAAIKIYHDAGYTIMDGLNHNHCVEMKRPDTYETVEWLQIHPDGKIQLI